MNLAASSRTKGKWQFNTMVAPAVFLLLFFFNCVFTKNFASINTIWNLVMQTTAVLLISLGMTMVISGGGIDISIGSIMAITAMTFAKTINATDSVALALLLSFAVGVVCGLINGVVVARFHIQPMIATMAMMYILRSLSKVWSNGGTVSFNSSLSKWVYYRIGGVLPIQVFIILAAGILFFILAYYTRFGVYVEACGNNLSAARSAGVRVIFYSIMTYVLCGVMAASAGILESLMVSSADPINLGEAYEMDAIAATVVGGTPIAGGKPNIVGTIFGAFTLQMITQMINMNNVQFEYTYVVKSVVIILAVLAHSIKNRRR